VKKVNGTKPASYEQTAAYPPRAADTTFSNGDTRTTICRVRTAFNTVNNIRSRYLKIASKSHIKVGNNKWDKKAKAALYKALALLLTIARNDKAILPFPFLLLNIYTNLFQ